MEALYAMVTELPSHNLFEDYANASYGVSVRLLVWLLLGHPLEAPWSTSDQPYAAVKRAYSEPGEGVSRFFHRFLETKQGYIGTLQDLLRFQLGSRRPYIAILYLKLQLLCSKQFETRPSSRLRMIIYRPKRFSRKR